jgi:hypothetical protein
MTGETVIGVFAPDRLNPALAALHRAGFGAHARVLDGARGNLAAQWRRANLSVDLAQLGLDAGDILILISAPGRSAIAASTLAGVGARAVWRIHRATLTRHEGTPTVRPALDDTPLAPPISEPELTVEASRSNVPLAEDIQSRHTETPSDL